MKKSPPLQPKPPAVKKAQAPVPAKKAAMAAHAKKAAMAVAAKNAPLAAKKLTQPVAVGKKKVQLPRGFATRFITAMQAVNASVSKSRDISPYSAARIDEDSKKVASWMSGMKQSGSIDGHREILRLLEDIQRQALAVSKGQVDFVKQVAEHAGALRTRTAQAVSARNLAPMMAKLVDEKTRAVEARAKSGEPKMKIYSAMRALETTVNAQLVTGQAARRLIRGATIRG